ncbi:hypothetical protein [Burkholderia gladioli]|uniref:hypothetical protein n=1 Tax=Burkholderia gladioli TaxID=28095 RepID=UPI0011B1F2CC|nr:hypothetical protein [Burkholderia gladioli]
MSWHSAEWLSLAQAIAGTATVVGAFGVVFLQNTMQQRQKVASDLADRDHVLAVALIAAKSAFSNAENLYLSLIDDLSEARRNLAIDVLADSRASIDRINLRALEERALREILSIRTDITRLISLCQRIDPRDFDSLPKSLKVSIDVTGSSIKRSLDTLQNIHSTSEKKRAPN